MVIGVNEAVWRVNTHSILGNVPGNIFGIVEYLENIQSPENNRVLW